MLKNEKKSDFDIWIVPAIAFVITAALAFYNVYLALIALALTAFAIYKTYTMNKERENELRNYVDRLDMTFDGLTKNAIFKMPFPIAVVSNQGHLVWYNNIFKGMTTETDSLVDKKISELVPSLDLAKSLKAEGELVEYRDRIYKVFTNSTEEKKGDKIHLLYFLDVSDHQDLIKLYEDERLLIVNIQIDNYDELVQTTPNERRPLLFAQIDRIVSLYFHDFGASVKKYENDKYIGIIESSTFNQIEADKFSLVDQIRDIKIGNSIPPTLSMGIGRNESTPREIERAANAALDIALGRGGDQIVIKDKEELKYFGGKNKATEKRTKVKARVIAHALGQLIEKSTEVFVMGHKNPDMDSFGSALGLIHAVERKKKKAYLVLKEVTPAIKNLHARAMEKIDGLKDIIISPEEAYSAIKASSLIIVTDNHRKNSTEEPRLFEKSSNVVVIDHHRRGKDYIDNVSLIYLEPYASSSSELVTEMLMYTGESMDINQTVAEGLLAGITVDTKNFTLQTGVRTFEAASVLKRHGADSMRVRELFKDDIELIKTKADIIANSIRINGDMMLGVFHEDSHSSSLIASQVADDLLNADGIIASFVLTRVDGKTHISARSLGKISVQLIMEHLGGGGHLTAAATQLDMSIEEAKAKLLEAIETYRNGEKE